MQIYDVIVVGAGPAGIAASAYAHRLGLSTLLVYELFGGQLNYTNKLHSVIFACDIRCEEILKRHRKLVKPIAQRNLRIENIHKEDEVFYIKGSNEVFCSKTVIICSGRKALLPDFTGNKVYTFQDYPYNDVTHDDNLLIVGGGYTGLDISEYLADKVNSITIVEKREKLGGNLFRQDKVLKKKNVTTFFNSGIIIQKQGEGTIHSNIDNSQKTIQFSKVFSCIGTQPDTAFLSSNLLSSQKEIKINSTHPEKKYKCMMSVALEGIFAAGDVIDRPIVGYASIAESNGLESAIAVYNYLNDPK